MLKRFIAFFATVLTMFSLLGITNISADTIEPAAVETAMVMEDHFIDGVSTYGGAGPREVGTTYTANSMTDFINSRSDKVYALTKVTIDGVPQNIVDGSVEVQISSAKAGLTITVNFYYEPVEPAYDERTAVYASYMDTTGAPLAAPVEMLGVHGDAVTLEALDLPGFELQSILVDGIELPAGTLSYEMRFGYQDVTLVQFIYVSVGGIAPPTEEEIIDEVPVVEEEAPVAEEEEAKENTENINTGVNTTSYAAFAALGSAVILVAGLAKKAKSKATK